MKLVVLKYGIGVRRELPVSRREYDPYVADFLSVLSDSNRRAQYHGGCGIKSVLLARKTDSSWEAEY
jgi:hypothetical protein